MKRQLHSNTLFLFASALCLLTFQFARALTSISIGLLLVSGVWALIESPQKRRELIRNPLFVLSFLFYFLLVLDVVKPIDHQLWADELLHKAGIIIIPFAVLTHLDADKSWMRKIIGAFVVSMALSAGLSSGNYLLNMDEINPLLLQSKHVPIIADVHHIYFGLFLAVSTILTFWLFTSSLGKDRQWWMLVLLIQFLSMHLLSSRTGLIAFYAAVYLMALIYLVRLKKVRYRLYILTGLILLPLMAVFLSPSLRHKISNTREDIEAAEQGGDDINFKSFAMRMEAWKMCVHIIKAHPFTGVGASELEKEMAAMYTQQNTVLIEENRVGPHNQILESTVAHGFLGGLTVMALFLVPFGYREKLNIIFIGIWAVLGTSVLVESLFERQLGLILFGFFYFLSFYGFTKPKMTVE
mgnify:CR=1 FL=1